MEFLLFSGVNFETSGLVNKSLEEDSLPISYGDRKVPVNNFDLSNLKSKMKTINTVLDATHMFKIKS